MLSRIKAWLKSIRNDPADYDNQKAKHLIRKNLDAENYILTEVESKEVLYVLTDSYADLFLVFVNVLNFYELKPFKERKYHEYG